MLEKKVQKDIVDWLDQNQYYCFSTSQYRANKRISAGTKKGVPDIVGLFNDGTFFCIEVKRPKMLGKNSAGVVSKEQKEFIGQINARNGLAFVAMSVKDVQEAFQIHILKKSLIFDITRLPSSVKS
jgi:penicillin-binding protein-related factor A (putative recombinase)